MESQSKCRALLAELIYRTYNTALNRVNTTMNRHLCEKHDEWKLCREDSESDKALAEHVDEGFQNLYKEFEKLCLQ